MSVNVLKMKHNDLHEFIKTINLENDYIDKKKYISKARATLKEFATKILGLNKNEFKVTANEGGQMVCADVYLRTNSFEIHLKPEKEKGLLMYRSCEDLKGSNSGTNHWISIEDAFNTHIDKFVSQINRVRSR